MQGERVSFCAIMAFLLAVIFSVSFQMKFFKCSVGDCDYGHLYQFSFRMQFLVDVLAAY